MYLFDDGSTVSWIPCGRKLTCSYPGEGARAGRGGAGTCLAGVAHMLCRAVGAAGQLGTGGSAGDLSERASTPLGRAGRRVLELVEPNAAGSLQLPRLLPCFT